MPTTERQPSAPDPSEGFVDHIEQNGSEVRARRSAKLGETVAKSGYKAGFAVGKAAGAVMEKLKGIGKANEAAAEQGGAPEADQYVTLHGGTVSTPDHAAPMSKAMQDALQQQALFKAEHAKIFGKPMAPTVESAPSELPMQTVMKVHVPETTLTELQMAAEKTYHDEGNVRIDLSDPDVHMDPQEIIERMETDHSVKKAPVFLEQAGDESRTNQVTYVSNTGSALTTDSSGEFYEDKRVTMTEHEMLAGLRDFLNETIGFSEGKHAMKRTHDYAASLRENLTFIGQKEYQEATKGIADYWKALLEKNPNQQILAVTGEIDEEKVKSDQFLLENILQNFTDEEAEKYKGRLIVDLDDITAEEPEDLKIVLLDDWTISGKQLRFVADIIEARFPRFAPCLELQLVVASESRIKQGFTRNLKVGQPLSDTIPLRAYYAAHHSEYATYGNAHITGFHSSVDYNFENAIQNMLVQPMRLVDGPKDLHVMPPLTNIVRPYRADDFELTQYKRFASEQSKEASTHAAASEREEEPMLG